ncbi:MAG: nucleotidyltransferase domain-containing protein [Patescibacteria group bacterium]|nr:nucleotidyltransferase domain-containing protein [Patescibacteria group bacterium]
MSKGITSIINKLKSNYKPEKIILFGSYAYGKPTADSDVDLAVIIKDSNLSYHERLIAIRRLVRTTTPIDFLVLTQDELKEKARENFFLREILERGKIVYEK